MMSLKFYKRAEVGLNAGLIDSHILNKIKAFQNKIMPLSKNFQIKETQKLPP